MVPAPEPLAVPLGRPVPVRAVHVCRGPGHGGTGLHRHLHVLPAPERVPASAGKADHSSCPGAS
eukprot:714278-Pyramimonas_sp.AAC.1